MDTDICAICLQPIKLIFTLSCNHSFCYLCLKESLMKSCNTCSLCRHPIDNSIIEHAKTSHTIDMNNHTSKWLYSGRNDGWWYYDTETSTDIERGYQQFLLDPTNSTINITVLGKTYTINFTEMTQRSLFNVRDIKRESDVDKSQIKGIAGLQLKI